MRLLLAWAAAFLFLPGGALAAMQGAETGQGITRVEGAYRPPSAVRAAARSAAQDSALEHEIFQVPVDRWQVLAAPSSVELDNLKANQSGIARTLRDSEEALVWTSLSDGSQVAAFGIESANAKGLRLGLELNQLPPEATLWFASLAPDEGTVIRVPASDALALAAHSGLYWSPTIDADALLVYVRLPPGYANDGVGVKAVRISHLYRSKQVARILTPGESYSCEEDATCYPKAQAEAVAHIQFVDNGVSYVCSGTLLNDADPTSWRPFFLTARHCVNSAATAATVESYWFYETETCNGAQKTPVHLSSGALLRFTSADTDTTLLELRDTPPADALYAGWSADALSGREPVFGIHHPQGDLKKISFGDADGFSQCTEYADYFDCYDAADGAYLKVRWTLGTTESGSSGSGLFKSDTGDLIAVLSHGPVGVCTTEDEYGLFSHSYSAGMDDWLGLSSSAQEVSAPVFSPAGGNYSAAQTVSLRSATDGASIRYTSDGASPSCSSGAELANGASLLIAESLTLRAIACKSGWTDSTISSASYTISGQVQAPSFSPPGGSYSAAQNVTLSSPTEGAALRYTDDGSQPSCASGISLSNGGSVTVSASQTLSAIACKSGWTDSPIASAVYQITGQLAAPTFSPGEGTYEGAQNVVLRSATAEADIRYSMDGSYPSCASGGLISNGASVAVNQSLILRALACKTGWEDSAVVSASYTLDGQAAPPDFDPPGGSYAGPQQVRLRSGTQAAEIRYTMDGTTPACSSGNALANGGEIQISASSTVKAIACLDGWEASSVAIASYSLASQLSNISTRGQVDKGAGVMVGGFVISGSASKQILIRAIGPSLSEAGIADALSDPNLALYAADGQILAENDDWQYGSEAGAIAALPWTPSDSLESAILATLAPGAYTAQVNGFLGATGVGMVEVYALDATDPAAALINISTRGQVGVDSAIMIGGFVIEGDGAKQVLIRAIGPSLTDAGVPGALADPQLTLYASSGAVMDSNDDWKQGARAAEIAQLPWPPSSDSEAAILTTLAPGAYTAHVSGKNAGVGIGMVEVYVVE